VDFVIWGNFTRLLRPLFFSLAFGLALCFPLVGNRPVVMGVGDQQAVRQ
jgi:hypothetical protein